MSCLALPRLASPINRYMLIKHGVTVDFVLNLVARQLAMPGIADRVSDVRSGAPMVPQHEVSLGQ
jgi:hypothetical protein